MCVYRGENRLCESTAASMCTFLTESTQSDDDDDESADGGCSSSEATVSKDRQSELGISGANKI